MSYELPSYAQEKRNTCTLACLRMVLTAHGRHVAESAIEAEARLEEDGTPLEELERLARPVGLVAHIQRATVDQLRLILTEGNLPIVYLNRKVFALRSLGRVRPAFSDPLLHAVIPTRMSDRFVTFHDPCRRGASLAGLSSGSTERNGFWITPPWCVDHPSPVQRTESDRELQRGHPAKGAIPGLITDDWLIP